MLAGGLRCITCPSPMLHDSTGYVSIYHHAHHIFNPVPTKMVYSTTRNTLTKSLGASAFTASPEISSRSSFLSTYSSYLTSKSQTTTSAAPLNAMEREMAAIRAAEREAVSAGGSSARKNHLGKGVGIGWDEEVEGAIRELGKGVGCRLVIAVSASAD
jgi:twinfilin